MIVRRGPISKDKLMRNHFAGRVFCEVADMDYISARTLYRNDCLEQFLILAQQCIEKYLKGILLYNEVKNTQLTHGLTALSDKCRAIPHFKISDRTKKFVVRINGYEKLRYAEYIFGAYSAEQGLLGELDYAVMDLRRYCHSDLELAQGLSTLDDQCLTAVTKRRGVKFHGKLEEIQSGKDKKLDKLRSNLVWENLYFSRRVNHTALFLGWWSKSSGFYQDELSDLYNAVKDYVALPKEVHKYFKGLEKNEIYQSIDSRVLVHLQKKSMRRNSCRKKLNRNEVHI
jgi:HEPN domain-containing protein